MDIKNNTQRFQNSQPIVCPTLEPAIYPTIPPTKPPIAEPTIPSESNWYKMSILVFLSLLNFALILFQSSLSLFYYLDIKQQRHIMTFFSNKSNI